MKFRWYVEKRTWKIWDSREERYFERFAESPPALQCSDNGTDWVAVPIVVEEIFSDSFQPQESKTC